MADIEDCFGCSGGVHALHQPSFDSPVGVHFSMVCPCTGDCAVRFKERGRRIVDALQGKAGNFGDPPP